MQERKSTRMVTSTLKLLFASMISLLMLTGCLSSSSSGSSTDDPDNGDNDNGIVDGDGPGNGDGNGGGDGDPDALVDALDVDGARALILSDRPPEGPEASHISPQDSEDSTTLYKIDGDGVAHEVYALDEDGVQMDWATMPERLTVLPDAGYGVLEFEGTSDFWLFNASSGQIYEIEGLTLASREREDVQFSGGDTLYALSGASASDRRLYSVDLDGDDSPSPITPAGECVSEFAVTSDEMVVYATGGVPCGDDDSEARERYVLFPGASDPDDFDALVDAALEEILSNGDSQSASVKSTSQSAPASQATSHDGEEAFVRSLTGAVNAIFATYDFSFEGDNYYILLRAGDDNGSLSVEKLANFNEYRDYFEHPYGPAFSLEHRFRRSSAFALEVAVDLTGGMSPLGKLFFSLEAGDSSLELSGDFDRTDGSAPVNSDGFSLEPCHQADYGLSSPSEESAGFSWLGVAENCGDGNDVIAFLDLTSEGWIKVADIDEGVEVGSVSIDTQDNDFFVQEVDDTSAKVVRYRQAGGVFDRGVVFEALGSDGLQLHTVGSGLL